MFRYREASPDLAEHDSRVRAGVTNCFPLSRLEMDPGRHRAIWETC